MRIKLMCVMDTPARIPYNYNYELQKIIYQLIENSSPEFSEFLHNIGFIDGNSHFKLFTFSKLFFSDGYQDSEGFGGTTSFHLLFSTPVQKSYEHLVLGIFAKQKFTLYFSKDHAVSVTIESVESLPEPDFEEGMRFVAVSPLVVSTIIEHNGKDVQHCLDYMNPLEREKFVANLKRNLLRKYRLINNKDFEGNPDFEFAFDVDYIMKRNGKIRKNIRFKKDEKSGKYSRIIGMEAPFTVKTDPELIKVGYQCGFGEKNSAGFGMGEAVL